MTQTSDLIEFPILLFLSISDYCTSHREFCGGVNIYFPFKGATSESRWHFSPIFSCSSTRITGNSGCCSHGSCWRSAEGGQAGAQSPFPALTQVLNGVVSLLVVHLDGLGVGAADAVADGVAPDHHVLVLGRGPAHHDAGDQRANVQRAGHLGHSALCRKREALQGLLSNEGNDMETGRQQGFKQSHFRALEWAQWSFGVQERAKSSKRRILTLHPSRSSL